MEQQFTCRMALPSDCVQSIAKYIHLTDPYIYPLICADPQDGAWCDFIRQCLNTPNNVYHLDHIAVLLHGDEIIGAACIAPCGQVLTITDGIEIPEGLKDPIAPVVDGYFLPLIRENQTFSGYNIVNICVDEAWRGRGLGKKLLDFCLEKCQDASVHLDVIADNTTAIRLYEHSGFRIRARYMGFSGSDVKLPCYHMIKGAQ